MLKVKITFSAFLLLTVSFSFAQNTLVLHSSQAKTKINKEIYGHFSEHLGTCIYEGIYVGEDSDIPNIDGYRIDVVEAFKELKVPVLRWPGGCFADTYHWKDGIGPKEERPSIVNVHWGGVTEDNSFGTHEFLDFCELIDTEPYLSINVGSGTVQEAAEWVEYVTSSNESPMTELRKENGREDPWDVKFWGIGNENWGCGGEMTPEYYANVYRNFACYVKGNDLQRVICGPSGGDKNWTEKIMAGLKGKMHLTQGVSLHYYTLPTGSWSGSKGSSIDFGEEMYFKTLYNTLFIKDYINDHLEIMDQYDPEGKVKLIVDEWGTWYDKLPGTKDGFLQQQNTLRDALVAGINLNIFNNHADRISMANIAQIVNVLQSVILTKGAQMVKTPTYHVFKMYNVHQDATLIPLEIESEEYEFNGQAIPALTASASKKDGITSITLTNANPNKALKVDCVLDTDLKLAGAQIITAENISDYNDFGKDELVSIKKFNVAKPKNGKLSVELPSKSVVLVQLQ
ncbi:alpha-L-arabinofuranosidase C-terminal domain-containing protein [uncultured Draconibacterium sp.]|uniref:alpha-N-arabinofuranosidase n=1 Tax=uncultured Draconibacterium sp. TaxID=1573823 RepID=UPI0025E05F05|nr:alpha-L-arabinofuranosidase C-terminal domain-containing protein [uncultured Draconibacterium sp.]